MADLEAREPLRERKPKPAKVVTRDKPKKAKEKAVEKKPDSKTAKKTATVIIGESWFWVSALYKLEPIGQAVLAPARNHQWERRVFVIRAQRGDERRVARRVAKDHETKHGVPKGEKAIWRLQEVEAYAELFDEQIESGTEVYWHFFSK
jgi:hypothetical protein